MKKIVLSLATLAALSTGAFASYRDVTTVTGDQDVSPFVTVSKSLPTEALKIAVPAAGTHYSAYERLLINSEEPGSSTK